MSFKHPFRALVAAAVFLTASTALAEDQVVAQMACQATFKDEIEPNVLVVTQTEPNTDVTSALVPQNNESTWLDEIPFLLQIFPGIIDIDGDVPHQVKELRKTTEPLPEQDFVSNGSKSFYLLYFLEQSDERFFQLRMDLLHKPFQVVYIQPEGESYNFSLCKYFYEIPYVED